MRTECARLFVAPETQLLFAAHQNYGIKCLAYISEMLNRWLANFRVLDWPNLINDSSC